MTGSGIRPSAPSRSATSRKAGTPSSRAASSQLRRRVAYSLSTRACGVLVSSTSSSKPGPARSSATCSAVVGAAVEEQRVPRGAQRGRRLVHQAGGRTDELVLRPLGQLGPLDQGDVQPVEVDQRGQHGALQRRGGGQSGPDRHVGGEHQVGALDPVSGPLQRPDHAGDVRGPAGHPGVELVAAEGRGLGVVQRGAPASGRQSRGAAARVTRWARPNGITKPSL